MSTLAYEIISGGGGNVLNSIVQGRSFHVWLTYTSVIKTVFTYCIVRHDVHKVTTLRCWTVYGACGRDEKARTRLTHKVAFSPICTL